MVFQGRLPTIDYLYHLRLGLDNPCTFCGLHKDNTEHLFNLCPKTQSIWRNLGIKLATSLPFTDGFSSGSWLLNSSYSKYIVSVIFAGAWFIWKSRCDAIFKGSQPNYNAIMCKAIAHANEFTMHSSNLGRKMILNNFSNAAGNFMFIYMNKSPQNPVSSVGFFLTNAKYIILLAGCAPFLTDANLTNELIALSIALQATLDLQMSVQHIFIVNAALREIINNADLTTCWRQMEQIHHIQALLERANHPRIHVIPKKWMTPAIKLSVHGTKQIRIDLRDLPRWLMKDFISNGFYI